MTIALKISQTGHSSSSSSNSNININGNNNINKSVNCDTIIKDKSVWWQPQFMSKEYQPVLQHSPRTLIKDSEDMAKEQVTRKWEVFAGRNRFYCNGRLMTAPHSGMFLLTVFLITGTSVLFFIYDCTYLAVNVTIAIPIIGGLLFLFTISALLRTSLTDPGIIPRATFEEAAYVEKQIEVTNSANSPTYRPPPRTKEVLVKGQTVKLKYCFTCKIFRPPRASHCSLCDNCVDRFDHHCPWVGNCVGRRNYRFFYMFIVSLAFLAVFIFACAIAHLILISKEDGQFLEAVKASPASMVVALICFFSVWSILGLAGFHTYLTTSNQTTNEDIKGSFASKRGQDPFNPYSQGNVCLNCLHILCGPIGPSLIDRRGLVTDEYKLEVSKNATITIEPSLPLKPYGAVAAAAALQNGPHLASEIAGVYRQTTENTESNAGSVTHLVSNEQPLAILPMDHHQQQQTQQQHKDQQYTSQPCLAHGGGPLYSNVQLNKSHSFAQNLDQKMTSVEDLHLDPVEIREAHILNNIMDTVVSSNGVAKRNNKLDNNDLTTQDKENISMSASRLRILRDTTMIESALDLDSLDDSSIGTGSQAGLMKVIV
ncbi:PREDICTED: palmitoyltransferase ZDHHC18 isoform X3 [Nicrophorus vespilloides]|uniref:Palmitoyltransferase n=1 Tax=Nicrophorus vespilloides TaxID=110193 RepID=A0ABM1M5J6_NICVS|nr:PREDICTED: palmitoyltransferase ZDHHC18 isoform X3 [Nicrophorus vespilloides]